MLQIALLGEINVRANGELITRFRSQTELALLAYLAHSGKTHSREALADLLWEARSTQQSLSNLRTVLARLRKRIGDQLVVTRKTVALPAAVHEQTDSVRLQAILAAPGTERTPTGMNLLAEGLAMYGGEFMASFSLDNAPRFNDWLTVEQERLRQMAMNGYRLLAGWQEETGAFAAGASTAQRWMAWDPLDETALQQLMRMLAYDGRPAEARMAYEKYTQLLSDELAVDPAPATTALYVSIQGGSLAVPEIIIAPPHNLPRALTPLFGRQEEIKKLTGYLVNPDYPLITVTGIGGSGKTSLALAAGRQLVAEKQHPFIDGIWFSSLEVIEDDTPEKVRENVAALVGRAVGLHFHGEGGLWPQLLGQLASKDLLLILDNIEQFLTTATDLIVDLLQAGEGVHLLVTSRANLALAASVAFPLKGLRTPARDSAEALDNESVRFFAERAARMPAPFDLQKNLADVVAICRFVEGLPLGIELAAASLDWLLIDEILPALTSNLQLLQTTRRDLPPRQRTFQAVFDYSWQLLNPREQIALAQISVFRGGFTREAAEALLNGPATGLYDLQNHALLRRDETGRFTMHPLLRQLAREKLDDPNMIEFAGRALNRHCRYFSEFINAFAPDLRRGVGHAAINTILPEQTNFEAAWHYAVQTQQWPILAESLDGAHYFFKRMGFFSEEAALVDEAVNRLLAAVDVDDVNLTVLLSRLFTARAWSYFYASHFTEGLQAAERACELAQNLEKPGPPTALRASLEGQARLIWGRILSTQHKRETALAQYEQVVALAEAAGDQILEADGWIGTGEQLAWQGHIQQTQESLTRALGLCREQQYKLGEMEALRQMGELSSRQEAYAASMDYHQQALALSRLLGDVAAEAEELGSLGVVENISGDLVGSQAYQQEALAIFRRLNMPESEAWLLGELGYTAVRLGDYAGGEEKLAEALAIATRLDDKFWQGWVKLRVGTLWQERGEPEKGLPFIIEAYQNAEHFNYLNFKAAVLYEWANVLLRQEDWAGAQQKFQEAYDLRQGSGRPEQALPSLAGMTYASCRFALPETAAAYAEQLWETWQATPKWADRANLKLYWMLGMVWDGLGDSRAGELWDKAKTLLQERAAKISDEHARKMFLEQVPAHRAILEYST